MSTTHQRITPRLTPLGIVERAEAREESWTFWAIFWLAIGSLVGAAAALTLVAIHHG
jgi:hypothetical protein